MLTTSNTQALLVDDVAALVVLPTLALTAAGDPRVASTVYTSSHTLRVPRVTGDPSAAWVAEGEEIPTSDAVLDELDVTPSKLAGLSIITSELANDSSPAAASQIGAGLSRDLARKLDAAFFGALPSPAPAGLGALSGVQSVVAAGAFGSTDSFSKAVSLAEGVGATTTAFIVGPSTALSLATLKETNGSLKPLLGGDGTAATQRLIGGIPVIVSAAVPPNVAWAVDSSRILTVIRQGATVVADSSQYFSSDRVAIRATLRAAFGFVHPQSVVKITIA